MDENETDASLIEESFWGLGKIIWNDKGYTINFNIRRVQGDMDHITT